MIFNCPECNAGHSVPVSMIPNGGLDMDCRRCGEAFTIEPPNGSSPLPDDLEAPGDTTEGGVPETTNVGPAPLPEATRVGVANPLEFEARPLLGPGGIEHSQDRYVSLPSSDTEAHVRAEDDAPLLPQEQGLDPEPDDVTDRLESREEAADFTAAVISDSLSAPSVYERVAAGIAVPEEQKSPRPTSIAPPPPRMENGGLFRPFADLLNRAPLALKVGLIVFPVTLGVMLVIHALTGESSAVEPPIEIPVAAADTEAATEEDTPEQVAPPPVQPARRATPPPPASDPPQVSDVPAPPGFAYVQVEGARLRVRPDDGAAVAGRIPVGAEVRVYDELGEWALVASLPEGPAGFVSRKLLDRRKPLAVLAREQAFERCTVGEAYGLDDCLFAAKQQEQPCLDRCGAVNAGDESERIRCAEVCTIAFDSCARTCRQGAKAKVKKRRR